MHHSRTRRRPGEGLQTLSHPRPMYSSSLRPYTPAPALVDTPYRSVETQCNNSSGHEGPRELKGTLTEEHEDVGPDSLTCQTPLPAEESQRRRSLTSPPVCSSNLIGCFPKNLCDKSLLGIPSSLYACLEGCVCHSTTRVHRPILHAFRFTPYG